MAKTSVIVTLIWSLVSCLTAAFGQTTSPTRFASTAYTLKNNQLQFVAISGVSGRVGSSPLTITSLTLRRTPIRAVLVVDGSGSMQSDGEGKSSTKRWDATLALALKIVAATPAGSELGLLIFSGTNDISLPLTKDLPSLLAALDRAKTFIIRKKAKTPLWDQLERANAMLKPNSVRDALVVISDGGDNSSRDSQKSAQSALVRSKVRMFAAICDELGAGSQEELNGPQDLRSMVQELGGISESFATSAVLKDGSDKLDPVLSTIAATIVSFATTYYEVATEMPLSDKPEKLRLQAPDKEVQLTYPHKLTCSER